MLSQGFSGNLFQLLRSLFAKARSRVKWNNELGELFENTYGVLQGGVIRPSLFKWYIEDMQVYFGDLAVLSTVAPYFECHESESNDI